MYFELLLEITDEAYVRPGNGLGDVQLDALNSMGLFRVCTRPVRSDFDRGGLSFKFRMHGESNSREQKSPDVFASSASAIVVRHSLSGALGSRIRPIIASPMVLGRRCGGGLGKGGGGSRGLSLICAIVAWCCACWFSAKACSRFPT